MAADLGVSLEQTGAAVGLVAGGRFAGNLAFSWLWGLAADRWGRRPCILISVVFQCVCTVFFAYSTAVSISLAVTARTLGGALNGAVPIAKTYISEITDSTNQGLAMTLITASWGAGLVIGPALGGYLSNAATKYSSLDVSVVRAYPYALPMVVVAVICAVAAILGWLFLTETLDRSQLRRRESKEEKAEASAGATGDGPRWKAWLPRLLRDSNRFTIVLLYAVMSVQAIGFDEMYNVWLAVPREAGGMGFSTDDIGSTLVVYGIVQAVLIAPIFQVLERRLGMVELFQWAALLTAGCYVLFPLIPRATAALGYRRESRVTYWTLVAVVAVSRIGTGITFVIQAVFTNNSVDQRRRGSMNGLSMTMAAAVRTFTPLFFGWTFGVTLTAHRGWPLDNSLVFTLAAVLSLHASHICSGLPRSIEKQYDG
mmetsp:Transcript_14742/g.43609  ORF Transcript_14742/g.43609 Transcript_14742/m.43609 type:complete len:427 (-) Transcript_14742:1235-2515(-)